MDHGRTVYPRWRGELWPQVDLKVSWGGLSPLARGTHTAISALIAAARFIPAGAGNSNGHFLVTGLYAVYPRWRGELLVVCLPITEPCGLSPLARGTREAERKLSCNFAVYPRWRGELSTSSILQREKFGLSPLARGTLSPRSPPSFHRRFIPAGAGNSRERRPRPSL